MAHNPGDPPIHHADLGSIRYHKASTPYYYEVDNIPIIDLADDSRTLVDKVNEIIDNMYTVAEIDQRWLDQYYVSKMTHFLDVSSSPPLNDYSGNNLQKYVLAWNLATFSTSAMYEPKVLELEDLNYVNLDPYDDYIPPVRYNTLQFVLSAGEFQFKPQMTTRILSAAELINKGNTPLFDEDDSLYMKPYRVDHLGRNNGIDFAVIGLSKLCFDQGGGIVPIEAQDYPGIPDGAAPWPHHTDDLHLSSVKIGTITSIYVKITASSMNANFNPGTGGTACNPATGDINYQVLVCDAASTGTSRWKEQCLPIFDDLYGYPSAPELKTDWEWQGWIPIHETQVGQPNSTKFFYLSIHDTDCIAGLPPSTVVAKTFSSMYIELVAIETKQRQGNPRPW